MVRAPKKPAAKTAAPKKKTSKGMTKEECQEILHKYHRWNHGQTSVSLAEGGARQPEDDIYDERRNLILAATKRLTFLVDGDGE